MIFYIANKLLRFISKLFPKKTFDYSFASSDEDVVRNLNYLAHSLRKIKLGGAGISVFPIAYSLKRGYKTALEKEKRGLALYEFEKWLKGNYRLIYGWIEQVRKADFVSLPHTDGIPRIVILADFIVKYAGNDLSRSKIENVVKTFMSVTPLIYPELALLSEAIALKLLTELSFVSDRSVGYFENYVRAQKKSFNEKYVAVDSYLSYYFKAHSKETQELMKKYPEIDSDGATLGFENVIAADDHLASSLINELRELPKLIPDESFVSLSKTNEIYSEDADYRSMSDRARKEYLSVTYEIARNLSTTESVIARAALFLAKKWGVHFGTVLYKCEENVKTYLKKGKTDRPNLEKRTVQGGYATAVIAIALFVAAFPAYYLRSVFSYFAILPLFIAALRPVEYLLKRFLSLTGKKRPVPQMDYAVLPDTSRTVVTVSHFISGESDVDEAIRHASVLAASCKDKNVYYSVVADLPQADEAETEKDQMIFEKLKKTVFPSRVSFLIRRRRKNGEKWGGYERKRGALLDFLSAVETDDFSSFYLFGERPKGLFAILLDDDSSVLPGAIKAAIQAMSHPLNAEYDLLTFGGKINRFSLTTYYSDKYARSCAIEAYPFYSDFYSERFDAAIYSGKAIVRIASYVKKLKDCFPDGKILSHDVIEGAVLRSSTLKRCVYEDAPKTFAADVLRDSRWQRGDVQLLPYAICPKVKNKNGERIKNSIAPIYKLVIFINGVSVLGDACVFGIAIAAMILNVSFLLYYALSVSLLVYVYALIVSIRSVFGKIRFRHAFAVVLSSAATLSERFLLLPFRAVNGAYLFFTTVFKMLLHSKTLLSWTPFKVTQSTKAYADGAKIALPSVILVAATALLLGRLLFTIYAFLFCASLFYEIFSGEEKRERKPEEKERTRLLSYVADIYSYFSDQDKTKLIPDNLQFFPYEIEAEMTSPTNIGFAILAEVCASILGFIDPKTALERIKGRIESVEKLEKWKGHLYNWYDIKTYAVKPPRVVSTVDSANFVACVSVACSFAKEKGDPDLAQRLEAIITETDFTALYVKSDRALAVVQNVSENRPYGRYDLLASESRLAYYFAIEQGVDPECYFTLGRDCSSYRGNTLLSWSGTAFEYMLPRLFLKAPMQSLLFAQERNSFSAQADDRSEGVFGRSECAYHAFNDATAYKYKAIGCEKLSISGECANVIAPYATFLYLPCDVRKCVENLILLEEKGARGKYGFYESIDFDEGGVIVQTFMTHHQGMSLAAITNALTGDALVRLFLSRAENASIELLLAEENVYTRQPKLLSSCPDAHAPDSSISFPSKDPAAVFAAKDGDYSIVIDSLGRGFSAYKGKRIHRYLSIRSQKGGFFFQVKKRGETLSPKLFPLEYEGVSANFSSGGVQYEDVKTGLISEVYPLKGYNGEMRKLTIENDENEERTFWVSGYTDLVLNEKDAYDSHPAFSDMFVFTKYDLEKQTIYAMRKNMRSEISIAVSMTVKGLDGVVLNSNRYNVPGREGEEDIETGIKRCLAPPFGDVLYPCFAFGGEIKIAPHSRRSVYVCFLAADREEELTNKVEKISLSFPSGALDLLGRSKEPRTDLAEIAALGKCLLYERPSNERIRQRFRRKEELLRLSFLPEDRLFYYSLERGWSKEECLRWTAASSYLYSCGVEHKLVFGVEKTEGAGMDAEAFVHKLTAGCENVSVLPLREAKILESCADVTASDLMNETETIPPREILVEEAKAPAPKRLLLRSGEGGFSENGYVVIPFGRKTFLPYANVVGASKGGFVVTENGGGFSFGLNAREDKRSVWSGDPIEDFPSERVFLHSSEKTYSLSNGRCVHSIGTSSFVSETESGVVVLNEYLVESGETKVFEIVAPSLKTKEGRLSFELFPALGWRGAESVFFEREGNAIRLTNAENGKSLRVYSIEGEVSVIAPKRRGDPFVFTFCGALEKGVFRFAMTSSERDLKNDELPKTRAKTLSEIFVNAIRISSPDPELDLLYNVCLPYQTQSARLHAKAGFYQVSGAYGFRDQLQDVLSMLISHPQRVREQILLCAEHQFEEGDVQHWWHPPRAGVRTRISDDRLWLCYVTEKYVSVTGDRSILDVSVPFLFSDPLGEGEQSRYEIPLVGSSAPLREHLLRAIRVSLFYGEHGLLKIGTGDWNDGLDRVGEKGRGESVWLTEFAYSCITNCARFFDDETQMELKKEADKIFCAMKPLLKGGRYPLCFTDDGEWLGYKNTSKCTIALNPQTWAVLSGAVSKSDAETALISAKELYDESVGIIKLSSPPFDQTSNYGYISSYPKGVRENGGQYTHAAIWYVKALLEIGKTDEAYRVIRDLNPIGRARSEEGAETYKGEPYVLAGDVYGVEPYVGRAGWTWYTGSAAWLKYTLTEDFLGIKKRGNRLYVHPRLPSSFDRLSVRISLDCVSIELSYKRAKEDQILFRGEKRSFVSLDECKDGERIEIEFV